MSRRATAASWQQDNMSSQRAAFPPSPQIYAARTRRFPAWMPASSASARNCAHQAVATFRSCAASASATFPVRPLTGCCGDALFGFCALVLLLPPRPIADRLRSDAPSPRHALGLQRHPRTCRS